MLPQQELQTPNGSVGSCLRAAASRRTVAIGIARMVATPARSRADSVGTASYDCEVTSMDTQWTLNGHSMDTQWTLNGRALPPHGNGRGHRCSGSLRTRTRWPAPVPGLGSMRGGLLVHGREWVI